MTEPPKQAEEHGDSELDTGDLEGVIYDGVQGDPEQGGSGGEEEDLVRDAERSAVSHTVREGADRSTSQKETNGKASKRAPLDDGLKIVVVSVFQI